MKPKITASSQLNRRQKVAALLLAFGEELAAEVLRHMHKDEVKDIARYMQDMQQVDDAVIDGILQEFSVLMQTQTQTIQGGKNITQNILKKAFKGEQAEELLHEMQSSTLRLDAVSLIDGPTLASFIAKEHPQTIALVLAFCDAKKCGEVLKHLPASMHVDLVQRMANLGPISPEMVSDLDETLQEKIRQRGSFIDNKKGGVNAVAQMLNKVDAQTRAALLEGLEASKPDLAKSVQEKMFTFEDLLDVPDAQFVLAFKHIDLEQWKIALKLCSENLKTKIFKCMSERAAALLQEDLAALPPKRKSEVEAVQISILEKLKELEKQGKITLTSDDTFV